MDVLRSLKNKVASAREDADQPQEVSQPVLDRIRERVSGGTFHDVHVWCRASWGSGCDDVNVV